MFFLSLTWVQKCVVASENTQAYTEQPESSADTLDKASRKSFITSTTEVGTATD